MTALNGAPAPEPDPAGDIARMIYEEAFEPGDTPWGDLADEDRDLHIHYAAEHIGAHMAWLDARGFRLLPPGAVPRPKSEDEAMAMLKASKDWFDAKKRKGGLVGGVAPRKLILPPGTH